MGGTGRKKDKEKMWVGQGKIWVGQDGQEEGQGENVAAGVRKD